MGIRGNVFVKRLCPDAVIPGKATIGSAGYDLHACLSEALQIEPGETRMIGSGFAIQLPTGYAAFIYARSGLGVKKGIVPANCVGVIDSDYRGEVMVGLRNQSSEAFVVHNGDRIAQMVIAQVESPSLVECSELDSTLRADGGFGSSGN